MTKKIKFQIGTTLSGPVYMRQTDIQCGRNGKNIFTPEEVAAMDPSLYEVVESSPCESEILRESALGKGWVKVREDQTNGNGYERNQILGGYQSQTQKRGMTASVQGKNVVFVRPLGTFKITVFPDSTWECSCDCDFDATGATSAGEDPQTMCSHLDLFHPSAGDQESFRMRTEAAYRKMGLSLAESSEAADIEKSVMLRSWARILGSEEMAKAFLKGEK